MIVASAYPDSQLSALSMTVIAVVVALALAAWLILVFLADRPPRHRDAAAGQAGPEPPGQQPAIVSSTAGTTQAEPEGIDGGTADTPAKQLAGTS